jgi:integrase/recombinase XerD
MAYQYVREPLLAEEADKLCSLTPQNILWQQKSLRINDKGGLYGKKTKKE